MEENLQITVITLSYNTYIHDLWYCIYENLKPLKKDVSKIVNI